MTDDAMMRAAVLEEHRSTTANASVRWWPRPTPREDEVLIQVHAVTASTFDVHARTHPLVALPRILGKDPAGVVVEVGEQVRAVGVGDQVTVGGYDVCHSCSACRQGSPHCEKPGVVGIHRDGGQAEFVTVPEPLVVPIPVGIDFARAATMANTYSVAWNLVVSNARVGPEDSVLVMGAAGGVGLACIQVARAMGARVIAGVSTDHKADQLARLMDLAEVVNYSRSGWAEQVRELTDHGPQVVVDNNGNQMLFTQALGVLAPGGRYVTCGTQGDGQVALDLTTLYLKRQSIIGVNVPGPEVVRASWQAVASGALPPPPIQDIYTLEELPGALNLIASRRAIGRTLLRVVPDSASLESPSTRTLPTSGSEETDACPSRPL